MTGEVIEARAIGLLRQGRSDEDVASLTGVSLDDVLGLRAVLASAPQARSHFPQEHPKVSAFGLRPKR